jgi:hypothetical protein
MNFEGLGSQIEEKFNRIKVNYLYGCSDVPCIRRAAVGRRPRVPAAGARADTNRARTAILVLAMSD